jgi:hypothetical protein
MLYTKKIGLLADYQISSIMNIIMKEKLFASTIAGERMKCFAWVAFVYNIVPDCETSGRTKACSCKDRSNPNML